MADATVFLDLVDQIGLVNQVNLVHQVDQINLVDQPDLVDLVNLVGQVGPRPGKTLPLRTLPLCPFDTKRSQN